VPDTVNELGKERVTFGVNRYLVPKRYVIGADVEETN
jgi:hypothetical protein